MKSVLMFMFVSVLNSVILALEGFNATTWQFWGSMICVYVAYFAGSLLVGVIVHEDE